MLNTYYRNPPGLILPFVLIYSLQRWLILHTCRKPVFPPEIEATCNVEPGDPNVWPISRYTGEFANIPGRIERAEAKAEKRHRRMEKHR
jgi:hypothetical protein